MRLYEIEPGYKQELIVTDENKNAIFQAIKRDCSDFVHSMQQANNFLYRGVDNFTPDAFIGMSRENRKPLGSTESAQEIIDIFLKVAKFTALRSNSVFCTGRLSTSIEYGTSVIVFPFNNSTFTWSPKIYDLFTFIKSSSNSSVLKSLKFLAMNANKNENQIIEKIKNLGFTDKSFSSALTSKNEIMVHGKYYAFNVSKFAGDLSAEFNIPVPK